MCYNQRRLSRDFAEGVMDDEQSLPFATRAITPPGLKVRTATTEDAPSISALLVAGFADKFRVLFGDDLERVGHLLARVLGDQLAKDRKGVFVAELNSHPVGVVYTEPSLPGWREWLAYTGLAFSELGFWRSIRALPGVLLLAYPSTRDDLYISELTVSEAARGQRIGQALLDIAARWGWERGKRRLTLHVAADNAPALRLYRRSGFRVANRERDLISWLLFGIGEWYFMEKPLPKE
jgi:ribosomal protein S18 acetylase RimI-like enzyme